MSSTTFENAPKQDFPWLRAILPKRLQPMLRGLRKRWQLRKLTLDEPYRTIFPYTQVSPSRQQNLARLSGLIESEGIRGAVVECGVLDGGAAALMAACTAQSGRPIHLFDAWQGLPTTTSEDKAAGKVWEGQVVGSPKRVVKVMELLKVKPDRVHYHVGWFHETFPKADIPEIALLHIDCDFHDPVKLCLDTWYPRVVPGGFLQFDDYTSFVGCRTAVDTFLGAHPELQLETFGNAGTAYFLRKPLESGTPSAG